MKNKFLITLAAMVMVLVAFCTVTASAATYGGLTYKISNGEVTITDCNSSATSVVIPETIDGCPVTTIGDSAFEYCTSLTSVAIPDGVTTIGDSAFYGCTSLTSVAIPDSVTTIGYRAFYNCGSLTSVAIPDSVTTLGYSAFYNTAYYNDASNWENGVLYINNHLIEVNTLISGAYTIKEGTVTIGNSAFYDCESLTSVAIPDSVTTIGDDAFSSCRSLTSVTIPDGVTTIGDYAFSDCESLTSVTIPDGVTTIGDWAFSSCDSLTSVTIPSSVTTIGYCAFSWCGSLTSVTIPSSVTTIGYCAFSWCGSLTSIDVEADNPNYSSENGVLFDKAKITLVQYPAGKSGSYVIPDSVTTIGERAFSSCDSLTSVTIGDSVTTIGAYAFQYCSSLTSVTIPDSVTTIAEAAFYSTAYYNDASNWENGVLYINNHLIKANTSISGVYTIKEGTVTIGDDAFFYCESLTSVTIPDSVTTIGGRAFYNCRSLTSVTIPDSVTTIGEDAFPGCYSLTSVTMGDSVTTIGNWAFSSCRSLTSVTIPDSVTTIGNRAFYNCSSLTDIYYGGTEEDWEKVAIGYGNDWLLNATIHFTDPPEETRIPGDVDANGKVDTRDIILIRRYLAGGYDVELK